RHRHASAPGPPPAAGRTHPPTRGPPPRRAGIHPPGPRPPLGRSTRPGTRRRLPPARRPPPPRLYRRRTRPAAAHPRCHGGNPHWRRTGDARGRTGGHCHPAGCLPSAVVATQGRVPRITTGCRRLKPHPALTLTAAPATVLPKI